LKWATGTGLWYGPSPKHPKPTYPQFTQFTPPNVTLPKPRLHEEFATVDVAVGIDDEPTPTRWACAVVEDA